MISFSAFWICDSCNNSFTVIERRLTFFCKLLSFLSGHRHIKKMALGGSVIPKSSYFSTTKARLTFTPFFCRTNAVPGTRAIRVCTHLRDATTRGATVVRASVNNSILTEPKVQDLMIFTCIDPNIDKNLPKKITFRVSKIYRSIVLGSLQAFANSHPKAIYISYWGVRLQKFWGEILSTFSGMDEQMYNSYPP